MNTTGQQFGGRQLGTPNKLTNELRCALRDILFNEISTLQNNLDKLDTKDRIELLVKLLPYAMPKIEQVEYSIGEGGQFDWS